MEMKCKIGQIADILNDDDLRARMLLMQRFCSDILCGYFTFFIWYESNIQVKPCVSW